MLRNSIEAVIFDAEGVVVATESLWDKSMEVFFARRDWVYDRAFLKPKIAGTDLMHGTRILQSLYPFKGDVKTLAHERLAITAQLFQQEISWIPGFNSFFKRLQAEGIPLCIATSMAKELMPAVDQRLGLLKCFQNRVFHVADAGGRSKPFPDLFLFAAAQLKVQAEHCLVIEDAPNGIQAAQAAGMHCAALTTTFAPDLLQSADVIADSYEELSRWLFN